MWYRKNSLEDMAQGLWDKEYSTDENVKRKGMPIMVCPNCNADFYYAGEKKEEEHSYLVEDDECMPF